MPGDFTRARSTSWALAPAASVPTVQDALPVVALKLPPSATTSVKSAETVSLTTTPLPARLPEFSTVMVQTTSSPASTMGADAALVVLPKSGRFSTTKLTLLELALDGVCKNAAVATLLTVVLLGVLGCTIASTTSCSGGAPGNKGASGFQPAVLVAASKLPPMTLTWLRKGLITSLISSSLAGLSPLLLTLMV